MDPPSDADPFKDKYSTGGSVEAGSDEKLEVPADCEIITAIAGKKDVRSAVNPGETYSGSDVSMLFPDSQILKVTWKPLDTSSIWEAVKQTSSTASSVRGKIESVSDSVASVVEKVSQVKEMAESVDNVVRECNGFFQMIKTLSYPVKILAKVPGPVGIAFKILVQPLKLVTKVGASTKKRLTALKKKLSGRGGFIDKLEKIEGKFDRVTGALGTAGSMAFNCVVMLELLITLNDMGVIPAVPLWNQSGLTAEVDEKVVILDFANAKAKELLDKVDGVLRWRGMVDSMSKSIREKMKSIRPILDAADSIYKTLDRAGVISVLDSVGGWIDWLMYPINTLIEAILLPIKGQLQSLADSLNPFDAYTKHIDELKALLTGSIGDIAESLFGEILKLKEVQLAIKYLTQTFATLIPGLYTGATNVLQLAIEDAKGDADAIATLREAAEMGAIAVQICTDYLQTSAESFSDGFLPKQMMTEFEDSKPARVKLQFEDYSVSVQQGQYDDCWLMAPLTAALYVNSKLATSLVRFERGGKYTLRLWDIDVVVDGTLPYQPREVEGGNIFSTAVLNKFLDECIPDFGHEVSTSGGNTAPLLEKAVAKLLGSYSALGGGHVPVAFSMLFGATRQTVYQKIKDDATGQVVWKSYAVRPIIPRDTSQVAAAMRLNESQVMELKAPASPLKTEDLLHRFNDNKLLFVGQLSDHAVAIEAYIKKRMPSKSGEPVLTEVATMQNPATPGGASVLMDVATFDEKVNFVYETTVDHAEDNRSVAGHISSDSFSKLECGPSQNFSSSRSSSREDLTERLDEQKQTILDLQASNAEFKERLDKLEAIKAKSTAELRAICAKAEKEAASNANAPPRRIASVVSFTDVLTDPITGAVVKTRRGTKVHYAKARKKKGGTETPPVGAGETPPVGAAPEDFQDESSMLGDIEVDVQAGSSMLVRSVVAFSKDVYKKVRGKKTGKDKE